MIITQTQTKSIQNRFSCVNKRKIVIINVKTIASKKEIIFSRAQRIATFYNLRWADSSFVPTNWLSSYGFFVDGRLAFNVH